MQEVSLKGVTHKLGLGQTVTSLNATSSEPPVCPAGLLPMGDGPGTLAKATATSGHTAAATPVSLATPHALPPGHPASDGAEELVAGLPQAHHGPACPFPAARECQREDVFLRDGSQVPRHQARYVPGSGGDFRQALQARKIDRPCFSLLSDSKNEL